MTDEDNKWLKDNGFTCEEDGGRFVVTRWERKIVTSGNGPNSSGGYRLCVTRMLDRETGTVTWHGTAGILNEDDEYYSDGVCGKGPRDVARKLVKNLCVCLRRRIKENERRIAEVRRQMGLKDGEDGK